MTCRWFSLFGNHTVYDLTMKTTTEQPNFLLYIHHTSIMIIKLHLLPYNGEKKLMQMLLHFLYQ